MNDNTIKHRLLQFLKASKISQKKFELGIDVSNGYVNNLKKNIGADKIHRIHSAYPELNIDWLLTGDGEMYNPEQPDKPYKNYTEGAPYYDVDFECGFDELTAPGAPNPEYLISMPGYEKATLWCNATGHSMEPEISNGDIMALQLIEDFSFLPFGNIYAIITTNNMRTVKRLGRSSQPGCYRLIPTNREYDEQDLPISKIYRVYRVLGSMKAF